MTARIILFAEARDQLQVAAVMAETRDAYSRPAYGEVEWAKCAAILLGMGHNVEITSALLMSRLARFARDNHDATAEGFAQFLNTPAGLNGINYELAA